MKQSLMQWHLARDNQIKLYQFCEKHKVLSSMELIDDDTFQMMGMNMKTQTDNQMVKLTTVNIWYQCLLAGYRLNDIEIKHIPVRMED
jgi:hypothetical protein